MKKVIEPTPAPNLPAKIFKVVVRDDANEIGMVVAYPATKETDEQVIVRGEVKKFKNEKKKLEFLVYAQKQGFVNFETVTGAFDIERVVLEELVRRSRQRKADLQKKKQENGILAEATSSSA